MYSVFREVHQTNLAEVTDEDVYDIQFIILYRPYKRQSLLQYKENAYWVEDVYFVVKVLL
jgi:hypothetical protein